MSVKRGDTEGLLRSSISRLPRPPWRLRRRVRWTPSNIFDTLHSLSLSPSLLMFLLGCRDIYSLAQVHSRVIFRFCSHSVQVYFREDDTRALWTTLLPGFKKHFPVIAHPYAFWIMSDVFPMRRIRS